MKQTTRNKLVIEWAKTPTFPSTIASYTQVAFASRKELGKYQDEIKLARKKGKSEKEIGKYIAVPGFHVIRHQRNLPHKPIEGFRTNSVESAKRIIGLRSIQNIISAKFYDAQGQETVII